MLKLTVGLALVTLVVCSQCPNNEFCEAGQTCCQDPTGEFSCCPFHLGECCEDHIHCCPKGMLSSVSDFTCINATHKLPLVKRIPTIQTDLSKSFRMIPSLPVSEDDITCPDGSFCPAEFSCLLMTSSYGCCPVAHGLVCSDGKHCCPKYHECSADSSSCVKQKVAEMRAEPQVTTTRQITTAGNQMPSALPENSDVPCNDTASCPDETTCCKTKDGGWACCPLPQAVCCNDFVHCCPHGTTCNVAAGSCDEPSASLPWLEKVPTSPRAGQRPTENVNCDSSHVCPESNTCCKNVDGDWGCCPLPEAVCCTDGEHCCPAHYRCDVSQASCIKGDVVVPWYNKIAAQSSLSPISDLGTDKYNEKSICSAGSTCCHLSTGKRGCCPLPEAVCCSNQEHCCPKGYKCDLLRRSCIKTTWLYVERVTLVRIGVQKPQLRDLEKDIQCGGGYSCQDGQTCCPISQTSWGCCPYSSAQCCADMKHCCPVGYKCGEGGICTPAVGIDWNNWDNWRVFFSQKKQATTL